MAVAKAQIDEVLDVVRSYVPPRYVLHLLDGLRKTKAYAANKSFKDTVDWLHRREVEHGQ